MPSRRVLLMGASSAVLLPSAARAATVVDARYFPPHPGDAPFPSPEGTRIEVLTGSGGKPYLSGPPYLRDLYGEVHTLGLTPETDARGNTLYPWFINGQKFTVGHALEVAQGDVYCLWVGTKIWHLPKHYNNGALVRPLPQFWESNAPASMNPSGKGTSDFPADPAHARVSPENASSLWWNGQVQGAPYLKDRTGKLFQIKPRPAGAAPAGQHDNGAWLYIDGKLLHGQGYPVDELLLRGGIVYFHLPEFAWQWYDPGRGSIYNRMPPASWGGGALAVATPHVAVPPDPPRPATLPGSSRRILQVGAGRQFRTITGALDVADDGDSIYVYPGTYRESFLVRKRVILRGAPGAKIDVAGIPLVRDKGAIVAEVDCLIQGFEITGAGIDKKRSDLTCGVRIDAPGWYELRNLYIHDCMDGIGSSGGMPIVAALGGVRVERCGIGDGYSHNIYFNDVVRLIARNVTSLAPKGGHAFKSRAFMVEITGGAFEATDSTVLDFSEGTVKPFLVDGVRLRKPAGSPNHDLLSYGMEDATRGMAGGTLLRCTIDTECVQPNVLTNGGPIIFRDCVFKGNKLGAYGAGAPEVKGLPRPA